MKQAFGFTLAEGQTVPDERACVPYNAELAHDITGVSTQLIGRTVRIKATTVHMRDAWEFDREPFQGSDLCIGFDTAELGGDFGYPGDGDSLALGAECCPELPDSGGPLALPE